MMRQTRLAFKFCLLAVLMLALPIVVLVRHSLTDSATPEGAALAWFSAGCLAVGLYLLLSLYRSLADDHPIMVRQDGERFVLVEGLHRLEACKMLGEETIIGVRVQARKH